MLAIISIVFCVFAFSVESTDIAAVYKHGIILLKDADTTSQLSQDVEDLEIDLPRSLLYPISLAYEPFNGNFFIADANDKDTEIFSLTIKDKTTKLESLVSKFSRSVVDTITYDPSKHQLLWTDSAKHAIYSVKISKSEKPSSPIEIIHKNVRKPRGIALDYCERVLYWTERDEKQPSIKMYDMEKKSVEVLKEAKKNIFYQAIDYNGNNHELIWSETTGDEAKTSSCIIVVKSLDDGEEAELASFENCYPFSITSDDDYIYWSDWSRQGIMRLQRKDPINSLVKLVNTPVLTTGSGFHNGAYGIVNLQDISLDEKNACYTQPIASRPQEEVKTEKPIPFDASHGALTYEEVSSHSDKESKINLYTFQKLRLAIIILSLTCAFFMITIIILIYRTMSSQNRMMKSLKDLFKSKAAPAFSPSKKIKTPRRFGPKVKSLDGQLCTRSADDGIQIDIEDCCQMTLCDTPCFTSVKKEGKGYKNTQSKREDKEKLLDDLENA